MHYIRPERRASFVVVIQRFAQQRTLILGTHWRGLRTFRRGKMAGVLSEDHLSMSDIPAAAQEKEELWKYRAPYQVQKDHEFGSVKWRGKCHCGRVQYQLKRENPLAAKFCHCRACQVLHGL